MKQVIRLTENDLHRIIKNCVNEIFEGKIVNNKPFFNFAERLKDPSYEDGMNYMLHHGCSADEIGVANDKNLKRKKEKREYEGTKPLPLKQRAKNLRFWRGKK